MDIHGISVGGPLEVPWTSIGCRWDIQWSPMYINSGVEAMGQAGEGHAAGEG